MGNLLFIAFLLYNFQKSGYAMAYLAYPVTAPLIGQSTKCMPSFIVYLVLAQICIKNSKKHFEMVKFVVKTKSKHTISWDGNFLLYLNFRALLFRWSRSQKSRDNSKIVRNFHLNCHLLWYMICWLTVFSANLTIQKCFLDLIMHIWVGMWTIKISDTFSVCQIKLKSFKTKTNPLVKTMDSPYFQALLFSRWCHMQMQCGLSLKMSDLSLAVFIPFHEVCKLPYFPSHFPPWRLFSGCHLARVPTWVILEPPKWSSKRFQTIKRLHLKDWICKIVMKGLE